MEAGEAEARAIGEAAMRLLRLRASCAIEPGLSDDEFERVEATFGFRFADDHRAFLAAGLPVDTWPEERVPGEFHAHQRPWPDWRRGEPDELRAMLDLPVDGVLFDIDHHVFWDRSWGARPDDPGTARNLATERLAEVPRLVPVYGHRFLPAGAGTYGHPVLSVWQTDVIFYGLDLADFVEHEFGKRREYAREPVATVGFWRDLI